MSKVLSVIEQKDYDFIIVDDEMIESCDWSAVYNQYGQLMYDEEQNIEVDCIQYNDGRNFRTLVIDDQTYPQPDLKYTSEEEESAILAELEGSENWPEYERGVSSIETENYTFTKDLFASTVGIRVYCK